jgi:hypothetical protein
LGSYQQHRNAQLFGNFGRRSLISEIQGTKDEAIHLIPHQVVGHGLGLVQRIHRAMGNQAMFRIDRLAIRRRSGRQDLHTRHMGKGGQAVIAHLLTPGRKTETVRRHETNLHTDAFAHGNPP